MKYLYFVRTKVAAIIWFYEGEKKGKRPKMISLGKFEVAVTVVVVAFLQSSSSIWSVLVGLNLTAPVV